MFADFIKLSGQTRAKWADRLGITASYLSDLLNGNRVPSLELAVRIERLTEGAVPASSWIAQPEPVAPTQPAPANPTPSATPEEDAA